MGSQDPELVAWLMQGDPTIRWQTLRDLRGALEPDWQSERARIQVEGVGARLITCQDPDGGWGKGIYSPKWISTTYTLLLMRDLGFDAACSATARGGQMIRQQFLRHREIGACTCMVGMWLALGVRFAPGDAIYGEMAQYLLGQRLGDGGWNCRWPRIKGTHHSSFHTTLNVLDGVRDSIEAGVGPVRELQAAEDGAIELLLQHRMFRSDKTGAVIDPKFMEFHFPHRWHYDVLRGLDFIRSTRYIADSRLDEAFELLESRRRADGRWPAAKTYAGKVFFALEEGREGSRWITLRALRCQKARMKAA